MTVKGIALQTGKKEALVRKKVYELGLNLNRGKVAKDFNAKETARIVKAVSA